MRLLEFAAQLPMPLAPWFAPAASVKPANDFVEMTIPMPGVKKEDVVVEIDGRDLVIRGQARRDGFADIVRSFSLSFDPDVSRCSASLQDGVLELKLARANKATRIEVH